MGGGEGGPVGFKWQCVCCPICYLVKKAVTSAAPTPTAANASHELPPFFTSAAASAASFSELNLSGMLAYRERRWEQ